MSEWELETRLAAAAAADPPFPEDRFAGRGIVICAGGARLFTCAWVAIALLRRRLACALPIEVWHLGTEELGPPMRGLLEELGAEPVDAFEVAKHHQVERLGGWELKPYAISIRDFARCCCWTPTMWRSATRTFSSITRTTVIPARSSGRILCGCRRTIRSGRSAA